MPDHDVAATIVRDVGRIFASAYTAQKLEDALDVFVHQARLMIGAHQGALSYIPDGDFRIATHAISFSEKYAKYRSYDVMPTGEGIWALVVQEGTGVCFTQQQLVSHPRWCNFGELKDERGLEHPPMRGWLATPVLDRNGETVGLLQMSDKFEGDFAANDLKQLEHLAAFIAPILQVQKRSEELEVKRRVGVEFAAQANEALRRAEAAEQKLADVAAQLALPQSGTHVDDSQIRLDEFSLSDMMMCGRVIRGFSRSAPTPQAFALAVVRYLRKSLVREEQEPAFALVRMFRSKPYKQLTHQLQTFAAGICPDVKPDTTCLTLEATIGDQPGWCKAALSRGHRAIPLTSEAAIQRLPMIAQLIRQLGIPVRGVVQPRSGNLASDSPRGVFYVERARGSPHIPAQSEFVTPHQIASVVGFGDTLPDGSVFAVIAFSKVPISAEKASMFSHLSHTRDWAWCRICELMRSRKPKCAHWMACWRITNGSSPTKTPSSDRRWSNWSDPTRIYGNSPMRHRTICRNRCGPCPDSVNC